MILQVGLQIWGSGYRVEEGLWGLGLRVEDSGFRE